LVLPSDARRPASNGNTAAVGASADDNSDFPDDLEVYQNCALVARDAEQR
jgi:hypothetical protein